MKDFGLDFGLLIAYLVPGTVAAAAVDKLQPQIFGSVTSDQLDQTVHFVVTAIICGMVISLVRAGIIDNTFAFNLHRFPIFSSLSHYGKCKRVEINYRALTDERMLNALREAISQE